MKKNLPIRLCLIICIILCCLGCRSEDFLNNTNKANNEFNVSLLNKQQVANNKALSEKIVSIKSKFKQNPSKGLIPNTTGNNILENAIIGTDQVLLVEKNGKKTYTFPVSRTYLTEITESLVVRENENHTFSGILLQYNFTKKEQADYLSGMSMNTNSKVNIYNIEKIIINTDGNSQEDIQVDTVGCYEITWETGWCSAGVHYTNGTLGSQTACSVGGAPAPKILSVKDICNTPSGSEGGDGSSTGNGETPAIDPSGFDTIPFISLGYQYFETEDLNDPNYVLYNKVSGLFGTIASSEEDNNVRQANPDLFYYSFFYFKEYGFNNTTKAFVSERITGLINWYKIMRNNPNASEMANKYFLSWAIKYLLIDHPKKSWQEFYDDYIKNPCEKLQNSVQEAKDLLTIPVVKNQNDIMTANILTDTFEKGFYFGTDSQGAHKVSPIVDGTNNNTTIAVSSSLFTPKAVIHNHNGLDGYMNFSPSDINAFNVYHNGFSTLNHYYTNGGDGSQYVITIQNKTEYDQFIAQNSHNIDIASPSNPNGTGDWKKDTDIYKEMRRILKYFEDQEKTEDEAYDLAMGYLTSKYNMGIVISKKGVDGKFHPIQVESSQLVDPTTGKVNIIYNQINPCNL